MQCILDETEPGRLASKLVVATPDCADPRLDQSLSKLLKLVRDNLSMDIVFVTKYVGDRNVFRQVDASPAHRKMLEGRSQKRSDSYCQRVLDGRLPAAIPDMAALRDTHDLPESPIPIGAYLAAPVRLRDGTVYGTLCCISLKPRSEFCDRDLKRLQMSARLTARLIEGDGS